jgi:hypothetical protein
MFCGPQQHKTHTKQQQKYNKGTLEKKKETNKFQNKEKRHSLF